jgi:endo-alpha-1,4-polygalactosaminidase (GH114 family)
LITWRTAAGLTALAVGLTVFEPSGASAQQAAGDAMPQRSFPAQDLETKPPVEVVEIPDWRGRARDMIAALSEYGHGRAPAFTLMMRGQPDLLFQTESDDALAELLRGPSALEDLVGDGPPPTGTMNRQFARTLDGLVADNLYCSDTPPLTDAQIAEAEDFGLSVFSIERCDDAVTAQEARRWSSERGIISHIATTDRLNSVPTGRLRDATPKMVQAAGEAENVLFVLENRRFPAKVDWLNALRATNFDMLVVAPFYKGDVPLSADEVYSLKFKKMGSPRLVIAHLPLTEARDTAWYWKETWRVGEPTFIKARGPEAGTYIVDFADPEWRTIIGETFSGLMDLGFDGVMLDGLNAVEALSEDSLLN